MAGAGVEESVKTPRLGSVEVDDALAEIGEEALSPGTSTTVSAVPLMMKVSPRRACR